MQRIVPLFVAGVLVGIYACSSSDNTPRPWGGGASVNSDAGQDADASEAGGGSSGAAGKSGAGGKAGGAGDAGTPKGGTAGSAGTSTGGAAGKAGSAGQGTGGATAGSAGTGGGGGKAGSAGVAGSNAGSAGAPSQEICDGLDNDFNGTVDDGCDDDKDGYCDSAIAVEGNYAVTCPNGGYDCDDTNAQIYPGATQHLEGVDYDCDGRKEYSAEIIISVDDQLTALCYNGTFVTPFGPNYGNWPFADTYNVVLQSGDNVIGVSGIDTGTIISAFVATIKVNGLTFRTDGVQPPTTGQAYTPNDPEWSQTAWRYFPKEVGDPELSWCDVGFNDSSWGPAIVAKSANCDQNDPLLGELGHCPWTFGCSDPLNRCPADFVPYYDDGVANNEPRWIWDYYPVNLNAAWFRHRISLP